jgi:uncharacterized protein
MRQRLIVFLRAPQLGAVKSRLAATLGPEKALAAYRDILTVTLSGLESVRDVELRFTPDSAADEITPWLRPGWFARGQGDGDLGKRLLRAFRDAAAEGIQQIVIIGSDCPEVSAQDIAETGTQLMTHDVVLGPAVDGGYWLIGLRQPESQLFRDMPWSSDGLFDETRRRAEELGLRVACLRTLPDIDTEADWRDWLARSGRDHETMPHDKTSFARPMSGR